LFRLKRVFGPSATTPNEVVCYDFLHVASEVRLDKQRNRGLPEGVPGSSLHFKLVTV
jgi:hypothetical protein